MTINERKCEYCGNMYTNTYLSENKYIYTVPTRFCSKRCAGLSNGVIKPDMGKDYYLNKALEYIKTNDRYTTTDEILTYLKCSSKMLTKHGITVSSLNSQLGYTKKGSIFEEKIASYLIEQFDDLQRQVTLDGLVGKTGYPLRVDFYIPSHKLLIEADGSQHDNLEHPWHTFKNGTVAEYDAIKETYAHDNGYTLIRIKYKQRITKEQIMDVLVKHLDTLKLIR